MERKILKCIRCGVECCCCPHCSSTNVIKSGKTQAHKQRYYCKECGKRYITAYSYTAYQADINQRIILFTKEGLGIRSTARVLLISTTTLLKRIIAIAKNIKQPTISKGRVYEVDELRTYYRNKRTTIWIVYALDRRTKEVKSFNMGSRTNKTLRCVIRSLELSQAKKIYTDKLKNYRYIINNKIHSTYIHGTNHIERKNLTLRTHLKRLNRRTICFSRSLLVLFSVLRIYFWAIPWGKKCKYLNKV